MCQKTLEKFGLDLADMCLILEGLREFLKRDFNEMYD
jgi:hypothetical protein